MTNMQLQLGDLEIHGITEIEQFDVPLDFMFPEIGALLRDNEALASMDPSVLSHGRCTLPSDHGCCARITASSWLMAVSEIIRPENTGQAGTSAMMTGGRTDWPA